MVEWFLILAIQSCGNCNREMQLAMPSIEVCRQVRDINQGSKCVMTDSNPRENEPAPEGKRKR